MEVQTKGMILDGPKSRAGVRTVAVPTQVMNELAAHCATHVDLEPTAFLFTGARGAPIRRSNFNTLVGWKQAVRTIGAEGLHFHDLRHTGNMLAAAAGGSIRDLMARMGHDSMRAALMYQHATAHADQHLAEKMDDQVRQVRGGNTKAG